MPMLDVFNGDAFSVVSLTDAIIKAPYKPGRIGALGLFGSSGITTTTATVEMKDGRLSLIPVTPRGGPGSTIGAQKRTARAFAVPHLERDSTVLADEVQNVRAFGSENTTEAVQQLVNERLADLRAMHEVTLEHLRAGAIKGQVLDSDGSTVILDLFTEFGVSQQSFDIDLGSSVFDVRSQCVAIQRLSEAVLGAEMVTGYRALCGDDFFDALISCDAVKETLKYQESALLRADIRKGFEFGGITWENYRGRVGAVDFFPTDEAYVIPEGTSIFKTYFAPADYEETVNTLGLPVYAKQVPDPSGLNKYRRINTQSNPLCLNLRPDAVIKVVGAS
jgi:hypothetical protein